MQLDIKEKTKIDGFEEFKCPRCKRMHQNYYGYPTICDRHNCYEKGKELGFKSK